MYRKIFTPCEQNSNIPFVIPNEWYGQDVEVLIFPILDVNKKLQQDLVVEQRRKKREKLLNKYAIDLSNFKFNRDEANDYE